MIDAVKRALVLAPHTDDGEFGCGGTMARLVENGAEVRYVAFSIATRSLPEGFAPDTLAREVREATAELSIPPENLTVHDFDVRTFPEHRQEILELLIELWNDWQPDCVFQPSLHDVHQDHQTIAERRSPRLQAHHDSRLRDSLEQLRLQLPGLLRARAPAHRAEGRSAGEVRVAAAPPLRQRRVRLERRPYPRHQREPRLRRGVPGIPRGRLTWGTWFSPPTSSSSLHPAGGPPIRAR